MSTMQLNDEIKYAKRAAAMLNHPVVKRLAKIHPDAEWSYSTWRNTVHGSTFLSIRSDDPWDISTLPGVQAGRDGYAITLEPINKKIKLRGDDVKARVVLRVSAEQPYTEEEKALLRAVGKLVETVETRSYTTLVCSK